MLTRPRHEYVKFIASWICKLAFSLLFCGEAQCVQPVQATLEQASAWTGQPVRMIVTLYSPGPFSGTPSFDLPKIPLTSILKTGSPVVGSEQVDDETWLTQRHEFRIYAQRAGEIVIPSFAVRFSGKKTFTSDPEPMEGKTDALSFQSNRPPGASDSAVVIAAATLKMTQLWRPDNDEQTLQTGDVIQREIERNATGTTAMMLSPLASNAPDGIRVYTTDPVVRDKTARGQSTAQRIDTIKYQFERSGTYELPELVFEWFDTESDELKRETIAGRTFQVEGQLAATTTAEPSSDKSNHTAAFILVLALVAWICRGPVIRQASRWHSAWHDPIRVAERNVLAACNANRPKKAYTAILTWKRAVAAVGSRQLDDSLAEDREFCQQWDYLSRQNFAQPSDESPWMGKEMANAFRKSCKTLRRLPSKESAELEKLPPLNPEPNRDILNG